MSVVARWPHGDPSRVVRAVLAQPAYRTAVRSTDVRPKTSLLQFLWTWLVEHVLRPLFHPLAKALEASHGFGTVVGTIVVVAALAALGSIVFRLAMAFARPPRGTSAALARADLPAARSSSVWRALGRDAAARGDFKSAIAALFTAALVALDESGVVAFDAARTPGEYRRLVRRLRAAAAPPFDELAERFVRAAYAVESPGERDFEAAERAFSAFEPAVPR